MKGRVRAMSDNHSEETKATRLPRLSPEVSESSVPANVSGADLAEDSMGTHKIAQQSHLRGSRGCLSCGIVCLPDKRMVQDPRV